jgi:hypothetical protein
MASVLDMVGRLTDQGICIADIRAEDICAYSVGQADNTHAMLLGWLRTHAKGSGGQHAAFSAVGDSAAAADAVFLDSFDWAAEDNCPCCGGHHIRRLGVFFGQLLQHFQNVEGVRDWMPHASLVLQVSCFVSLIAPTLKH